MEKVVSLQMGQTCSHKKYFIQFTYLSPFPFFLIPADIVNRIEQLQRNFLWSGLGDDSKRHLVNWFKVCFPIQSRGLAI